MLKKKIIIDLETSIKKVSKYIKWYNSEKIHTKFKMSPVKWLNLKNSDKIKLNKS